MDRKEIENGIDEILKGKSWIYVENSGAELVNNSSKYNKAMSVCCETLADGQIYVTCFDNGTWYYYTTVSVI